MKSPLKVLLVPSPPPNGVIENGQDRYLDALVRGMEGRAEFIGLDDPQFARGPEKKWEPGPTAQVRPPRFPVILLIPRNLRLLLGYIRDTWRLARLLRPYRKQVDLIHVNRVGCEIQPIAAWLAGFQRIVTTIHNLPGEAEKDNWVCRLVERVSFACGDVHIAVSEATFEEWRKRLLVKGYSLLGRKTNNGEPSTNNCKAPASPGGGRCVVIYNGMDPEDLSRFDRRAYRRQFCADPDHTFIIGICARLHRMKGHGVLLEAFAMLLRRRLLDNGCQLFVNLGNPNDSSGSCSITNNQQQITDQKLLLLIAGSGPEEANIRAKITELGIAEHVRMVGHRNDAERFVASLDLNVLPSVELETLGYSVVEAMFAGVPSVVSDVGGMKELVMASGGGAVVPARDPGALEDALRRMLGDPKSLAEMGTLAREYALAHLTAVQMADATFNVYRN